MARVVLLNSLPLNAFSSFSEFTLRVERLSAQQLVSLLEGAATVESYVRHPPTVQLLSQLAGRQLPVNGGLYRYQEGDRLVVVVLRSPVRGQEQAQVNLEDVEFYLVEPARPTP